MQCVSKMTSADEMEVVAMDGARVQCQRLTMLSAMLACTLLLAGCAGGLHHEGQHQISLTGCWDFPISGHTVLYAQGEGTAENGGVTVAYNYFLRDRIAFTTALTPYRLYNQRDGDATAGELQIGFRFYFFEFDLVELPVGLYAEVLGGMMHGSRSVPEGGSHTNFTQDTGIGFELKLAEKVSWMSGYRYRHLSNGYIFASENPSQNDHMFYTGIAFTIK